MSDSECGTGGKQPQDQSELSPLSQVRASCLGSTTCRDEEDGGAAFAPSPQSEK